MDVNPITGKAEPTTVEQARDYLTRELSQPAFFSKLAQLGERPSNEEEARLYVTIGNRLLEAEAQKQVKEAAAGGSLLKEALAGLDNALSSYGYQVQPAEAQELKAAAARCADHPAVSAAVMTFVSAVQAAAADA